MFPSQTRHTPVCLALAAPGIARSPAFAADDYVRDGGLQTSCPDYAPKGRFNRLHGLYRRNRPRVCIDCPAELSKNLWVEPGLCGFRCCRFFLEFPEGFPGQTAAATTTAAAATTTATATATSGFRVTPRWPGIPALGPGIARGLRVGAPGFLFAPIGAVTGRQGDFEFVDFFPLGFRFLVVGNGQQHLQATAGRQGLRIVHDCIIPLGPRTVEEDMGMKCHPVQAELCTCPGWDRCVRVSLDPYSSPGNGA
jgi:hypothetical protein